MIRTGAQYRDSIRDGREVRLDGQRVEDVPTHPAFQPQVDARARMHDLQHEAATCDALSFDEGHGERHSIAHRLPLTQQDWWEKRRATDTLLEHAGGGVTRTGSETVGEIWSLFDGLDQLHEIDPRFSAHIRSHINHVSQADPFHVAAHAEVAGARLRVVGETDAGLIVRGAKRASAAAWANQAFVKPDVADGEAEAPSDAAVGFVCDMGAPRLRLQCSTDAAGRADLDTTLVFDDVRVPWENVLFHRHAEAVALVQSTLHRYTAFALVQRNLRLADMLIGAALWHVRRNRQAHRPGVRHQLSLLACYREGLHAHLSAAITLSERSPGGLVMPNQALLHAGRALYDSQRDPMVAIARALCEGAADLAPEEDEIVEDRRRLQAYARDLFNADHGDATLALGAQGPATARLAPVYRSFDWEGPLDFVRRSAGLSETG